MVIPLAYTLGTGDGNADLPADFAYSYATSSGVEMRYRRLGRTGLYVSEIGLGTMTFGGDENWGKIGRLSQSEATALLQRALELGVNFIDTADVYSEGLSETILGRALRDLGVKRSDVVIATKVGETGLVSEGKGPNERGASRGNIMDGILRSLDRLELDHVDLYQIHCDDPITPLEETIRALDDLVSQGLVRYIGCSNWQVWKVMKALGLSAQTDRARFETLQGYYTIADRDLEREMAPLLENEGVGLLVWSPLAGGVLSGKFDRHSVIAPDSRQGFSIPPKHERTWRCVDALRKIAVDRGVSVGRVALAWTLTRPFVTSVIIGAKRIDQMEDNLGATDLHLCAQEIAQLDEISALPREYPGWFMPISSEKRVPPPFRPKD